VDGGGRRAVLFAHVLEDHAIEPLILIGVILRGFDGSWCAKHTECVQLDSLCHKRRQIGVLVGLVGKAGLHLGGQGFPKIVGQRKAPPELGVFGENGDLRKVSPEEVINAAGTGLASSHLVYSAEAAEAIGDLTDGFRLGGGSSTHVVEAKDTGKEVQLAAVEKLRNAGGDGGRTGTVGGAAILFERNRVWECRVKGSLVIEE
jgi:hypothetical protein